MPEYVYRCTCGREVDIIEPMLKPGDHDCPECGCRMWRKPLGARINWNGLPPSAGELSPEIRRTIEDAPRRRDQAVPHKSDRLARL